MPRRLGNYVIKYDWMKWSTGTEMNGYGTSMMLEPVPIDPLTNERPKHKTGPKEGKLIEWTKKEWETRRNRQSIAILWMPPGKSGQHNRIWTLLKALEAGSLTGQAAVDVEALKHIVKGTTMPSRLYESKAWANDLVAQEEKTLEDFNRRELQAGFGTRKVLA